MDQGETTTVSPCSLPGCHDIWLYPLLVLLSSCCTLFIADLGQTQLSPFSGLFSGQHNISGETTELSWAASIQPMFSCLCQAFNAAQWPGLLCSGHQLLLLLTVAVKPSLMQSARCKCTRVCDSREGATGLGQGVLSTYNSFSSSSGQGGAGGCLSLYYKI